MTPPGAFRRFFSLIGWVLVFVGLLIVIAGLNTSAPFNALIAGIGLGIIGMGLLQVAAGQMLRATVDSADYSRQALALQIGMAQGRTEIDLQRVSTDTPELSPGGSEFVEPPGPAKAPAPTSDIAKGLSNEAMAVLRKAADKGYEVRLSSDKQSIILRSGDWHTSFSSQEEIIRFGQTLR